jgi:hypothetical protein
LDRVGSPVNTTYEECAEYSRQTVAGERVSSLLR